MPASLPGDLSPGQRRGGARLPPRLGPLTRTQNIATAMRVPGFATASTSNGTDTAFNSGKYILNESGAAVTAVKVIVPGWWMDSDANGAERDHSGNITLTGSIGVPNGGTRVAITWSGSTTGTLTPGSNLVSDSITLPTTLAAGGNARVYLHGTCTAGVKWGLGGTSAADLYESGASGTLADKTMAGTPGVTGNVGFYPVAVIATGSSFRKVCLATAGDSISVGAGDGLYDSEFNTGWNGRASTGRCPLIQAGVIGTTMQASAASGKFARRLDLFQKAGVTHLILPYGSNDLGSRTAAQLEADWLNVANQANTVGIKVVGWTILPRQNTGATNGWQTVAGQIPDGTGAFTAGSGSIRAAYNSWVRGLPSPMFAYIEAADAFDVNSSGTLTRDGGYWIAGAGSHLDPPYSGTVGAGATTTVIPTGIVKSFNYWQSAFGSRIVFTSGALSGTSANISTSDGSGNVTLGSALGSAPAQGTTFALYSNRCSPTADGTHPRVSDTSGSGFGGHFVLADLAAAKIDAWNA